VNPAVSAELHRAALLTFEQLGFMSPEDPHDGSQDNPLELSAQVRFQGPFSGELHLHAFGKITGELTANMLGTIEPPSIRQRCDAFAEAANVVCGNMLPGIAGTDAVFDLEAPQISAKLPIMPEPPALSIGLHFDEGHVVVELFLNEKGCLSCN